MASLPASFTDAEIGSTSASGSWFIAMEFRGLETLTSGYLNFVLTTCERQGN